LTFKKKKKGVVARPRAAKIGKRRKVPRLPPKREKRGVQSYCHHSVEIETGKRGREKRMRLGSTRREKGEREGTSICEPGAGNKERGRL